MRCCCCCCVVLLFVFLLLLLCCVAVVVAAVLVILVVVVLCCCCMLFLCYLCSSCVVIVVFVHVVNDVVVVLLLLLLLSRCCCCCSCYCCCSIVVVVVFIVVAAAAAPYILILWFGKSHEVNYSCLFSFLLLIIIKLLSISYLCDWLLKFLYDQPSGVEVTDVAIKDEMINVQVFDKVLSKITSLELATRNGLNLVLTPKGARYVTNKLNPFAWPNKDRLPKAFKAPIAVSAIVREDMNWGQFDNKESETLGVDMEAYQVFDAVQKFNEQHDKRTYCLVAKAVSSFGTTEKDGRFQRYASQTSAAWLVYFLQHYAFRAKSRYGA